MKVIPSHLQTVIASSVTTLATCWKITRTDGMIFGFTDYNEDLVIDGLTYEARTGYTKSQVQVSDKLNVDNMELTGVLESPSITEPDLMAGLWDFAHAEIFQVDYTDPAGGIIKLLKPTLGQVVVHRNSFSAEQRGMMQPLQNEFGQLYSAACRATLGDARCTVDLTPFTFPATVDTVTDNRTFTATALTQVDNYFQGGKVTFTSGNNNGLSMEVKNNTQSTNEVVLQLQLPYEIQVGDTFDIVAGCDKVSTTCFNKFNNIINFRGEPFVPGNDQLTKGI